MKAVCCLPVTTEKRINCLKVNIDFKIVKTVGIYYHSTWLKMQCKKIDDIE